MPLIDVPAELPGIAGLLAARPDTAAPLRTLAEALLRRDDGLDRAERELLATAVSAANGCGYCRDSHGAVAAEHLAVDPSRSTLADAARRGELADVAPPRLAALARIAVAVARDVEPVSDELIAEARAASATDDELHDTVLIAAAFSMFNRYVEGMRTLPATEDGYAVAGRGLAERGYLA